LKKVEKVENISKKLSKKVEKKLKKVENGPQAKAKGVRCLIFVLLFVFFFPGDPSFQSTTDLDYE
jgi:hypothetical protein